MYLLHYVHWQLRRRLMDISAREKNIWLELLITIGISVYYFFKTYQLNGWSEVASVEMGLVVRNVIFIAIVATVILYTLFSRQPEEDEDERDKLIKAKGNVCAYYCLTLCCVFLVGHIFINEISMLPSRLPEVDGAFLAHLLLIALMLTEVVKSSTQLVAYRKH